MKNLTIFTDAYDPQINGVVTTLKETKKELESRGWNVKIIHPGLFKASIPLQPSTGISMPIFPFRLVLKEIKNADKIHITTEGVIGLAARFFAKIYKKNYTTSFHTKFPEYIHIHTGIPPGIGSFYFRWFHRNSNTVMVATPTMVEYCNKLGIQNVKIWSRGVNTEIFKPKDVKKGGIKAVYVGRVSAEKNLETFLSISDNKIQQTIIGDGPQLEEYKRKYPHVKFLGKMSSEEIAEELPKHHIFAWPSLTDTFGVAMIEAMACGLPVAAFKNEVNSFIVEHDKSGFLTPFEHSEGLRLAILNATKLDVNDAINRAKTFSWKNATDQFIGNLT